MGVVSEGHYVLANIQRPPFDSKNSNEVYGKCSLKDFEIVLGLCTRDHY